MGIYKSYPDNELFEMVKNNDENAFGTLYDRYWDKLLLQARLKLKVNEDAEEVVQEVFLNLWRKRHTIQIRTTFHTYIASVVKYEILTMLSKQKPVVESSEALYVVSDNSTSEFIDCELLRDEIEETVQSLPEKCRLVFRLSRDTGMTEKEISHSLNISPKTVEAHISKALKVLRKSLTQFFTFFL